VTSVAIIDDHPVVREGLVAALERKFEIAGTFSSAEEALGRVRADVVLLDLELPGMSGLDAISRLNAAVLVLTAYDADEDVERAIRAGAKGYLLKGAAIEEIERAIAAVARGDSYVDPRIAARLVAPRQRLSAREREVLRLVAGGKSNKEIAAKLRISERTAKFHVTAILNKLGAENRAQAAAIAAEKHLI
jgi:DNA-binding NarL/FixJ family response regulator